MKALFVTAALAFVSVSAHAEVSVLSCQLIQSASGLRTVSSIAGELGDNEDLSPVVARGIVLSADCRLPLAERVIFLEPTDAAKVSALLGMLNEGAALKLVVSTLSAGMEGRDFVSVISVESARGTLTGLNGISLDATTSVK